MTSDSVSSSNLRLRHLRWFVFTKNSRPRSLIFFSASLRKNTFVRFESCLVLQNLKVPKLSLRDLTFCGPDRTRTRHLRSASAALYQMSYWPLTQKGIILPFGVKLYFLKIYKILCFYLLL